jgi:hypothetical protein
MIDILVIVSLILAIVAGLVATFSPQWFRLVGIAVAFVAFALLVPHFH